MGGTRSVEDLVVTLIVGGVGSGKSRYAQNLAQGSSPVVFIATAQPIDDEMKLKIERHRLQRPLDWTTIEEPFELEAAIAQAASSSSFLVIDCITTFTANLLQKDMTRDEIVEKIDCVCGALGELKCSAAIVSNEVGSGIVPAFPSGRVFRELLGEANQKIARISDNVILMVAGCPLAVRGAASRL
jgi:adenosylcobinamide kinase/adenosylcobinamide-phosphate guanylyltransferase